MFLVNDGGAALIKGIGCEPFLLPVQVNGKNVNVFLDSGSPINIISPQAMVELGITEKRQSRVVITTVSSEKANCEGIAKFTCCVGDYQLEIEAFIVPNFSKQILFGRETMFQAQIDVLSSNGLIRLKNEWFDCHSKSKIVFPLAALVEETVTLEPHSYNEIHLKCPIKQGSFVVKFKKQCTIENIDLTDIQVWIDNFRFTISPFHRGLFLQGIPAGTPLLEIHPPLLSRPNCSIDVCQLEVEISAEELLEVLQSCGESEVLTTSTSIMVGDLEQLIAKALKDVPETYKQKFSDLFHKHEKMISRHRFDLGKLKDFQMKIRTNCQYPVCKPQWKMSPDTKVALKEILTNLLKIGMIVPSSSPWGSSSILVKKPDNSNRLVNDYRDLNAVTIRDTFPIPRIDDITDYTAGASVFTTIDLTSGFWQIEIEPESREKTAFATPFGKFEYTRMAMGLTNGPPTFQACMQFVLGDLLYKNCIVYLDDILVYSKSYEEHLDDVDQVLSRLESFGLKIKADKCHVGAKEIRYLGHKISQEGIHCCDDKVETVRNIPLPINSEEVLSYLGLVQYYRKFIRHCSIIAAPLYELTRKNEPFVMTERRIKAFLMLKEALCNAPVMCHPNFSKEFWLAVDACNTGLGGVLKQADEKGRERVVSYASCILRGAQLNYHCTDLELLAVKWGIEHFRPYLTDKRFVLFTDHRGLLGKQQLANDLTGRRARWLQYIFMFNFEMRYKPGKENRDADALSRLTRGCKSGSECTDPDYLSNEMTVLCEQEKNEIKDEKKNEFLCERCGMPHPYYEMIGMPTKEKSDQEKIELRQGAVMVTMVSDEKKLVEPNLSELSKEPWAKAIFDVMIDNKYEQTDRQVLWLRKDGYLWRVSTVDNVRMARVCVHAERRNDVLRAYHDLKSHCGIHRTAAAIRDFYYWPKQSRQVNQYVLKCEFCTKQKILNEQAIGHLSSPAVPARPFQHVHIDVAGPFTKTFDQNMYIIAAMCRLTKYAVAKAIRVKDAETASKFLQSLFMRFGHIEVITTDNGTEFKNWQFRKIINEYGATQHFTSPGRAQGNGQIERFNRTIKDYIAGTLDTTKGWWSNAVEKAVKDYNTTIHNETGVTPHWLLYGYLWKEAHSPNTPEEVTQFRPEQLSILSDYRELARVKLEDSHEEACERYNLRRKLKHFRVGDIVVKKKLTRAETGKTSKLNPRYDGPFVVKKVLEGNTYLIQMDGKSEKYHADQLKMYVPNVGPITEK